ncbi:MAG: hypothetical protein AVDCRST_MAG89-343, partial [uncultured Gemmatimonadetes bacterium]
ELVPRLAVPVLVAAVLFGVPAPAHGQDPVQRIRQLYLSAVQDESAIARGMRALREVRAAGAVRAGSGLDAALTAYDGALATLRAKHGSWPPARLLHLRQGLAVMDAVVAAHPDHPEVRYLRLMSCYYLPAILGRGASVREDFTALARLLPGARGEYPPELYAAITRFVLRHGTPTAAQRRALEAVLEAPGG